VHALTQLVCPLCGRFVSLRHFTLSTFEEGIYLVEIREAAIEGTGLGTSNYWGWTR